MREALFSRSGAGGGGFADCAVACDVVAVGGVAETPVDLDRVAAAGVC